MTRIRATCPTCGEVDLRPADVSLQIVRLQQDEEHEVREGSTYRFDCPTCEEQVTKPADARIARLLTTGGVDVAVVDVETLDRREPHPEAPPAGPAFTLDDLIDFHFLLADHDDVVDAAAGALEESR